MATPRRKKRHGDVVLSRLIKENNPKGLKCTNTGCSGNIVRKPDENPGCKGYYGVPECEICGTAYVHARSAPKVPRTRVTSRR